MNSTPSNIVRTLCIGFLAGVAILSWSLNLAKDIQWMWLVIFLLLLGGLCIRFVSGAPRLIIVIGILALGVGGIRYFYSYPDENSVQKFVDQDVVLIGVVQDVQIGNSWQKIILSDLIIKGEEIEDRIFVIAPTYPEYAYGDSVRVECALERPEQIEDFAYDRYLAAKDIYATCFTYKAIFEGGGHASWKSWLLDTRSVFIAKLDQVFGEPHGSLLVGLLLGEQRFSDVWEERFLQTGTTHIVAASGYNISVVLWIGMGFFAWIGIRRQRAFAFLLAAVVGYILLAGADAAVFRAGVMGMILLTANQTGRRTSMINVLLLTALIMLFINPRLLRDDVGFQLSMMSTIGLIYLAPRIETLLRWIPGVFAIRESVVATLSATWMSLPILLFGFGQFAFVSLFANIFILPWIPLAMASGAISICIGFLSVKLAALVSAPAWLALSVMLGVTKIFASVPLFVSSVHFVVVVILFLAWIAINIQIWLVKRM